MKTLEIKPSTKIKVGDELVGIHNGLYAHVVKIVESTYHISFAIDYADERPVQRSRKKLEKHFHLIK